MTKVDRPTNEAMLAAARARAGPLSSRLGLEAVEPVFRVTMEAQGEERAWLDTGGATAPDPFTIELPSGPSELTYALPASVRAWACDACQGAGAIACRDCNGLGYKGSDRICLACGGVGRPPCGACGGRGMLMRGAKLQRKSWAKTTEAMTSSPPGAPAVLHVLWEGTDPSSSGLGPAVERVARELTPSPTPGRRVRSCRFRVEQLAAWKATWTSGSRSGTVWFQGDPLDALLDGLPRNWLFIAAIGWAAAMLLGMVAVLAWPSPPAATPIVHVPEQAPEPAPEEPRSWDDAALVLADGSVLRGKVERDGRDWFVWRGAVVERVGAWQVESMHERVDLFLARLADDVHEMELKAASFDKTADVPKMQLVDALIETQRQRERWRSLRPHCKASELAGRPLERLLLVSDALERRLAATRPSSAPAPAPALVEGRPPALVEVPAVTGQVPDVKREVPELARVRLDLSEVERERLRDQLAAAAPKAAKGDLVWAMAILLSRDPREWGLLSDVVKAKQGEIESMWEGRIERREEGSVTLVLPGGERLRASRAGQTWSVTVAGILKFATAAVTVEPMMPGRAKEAYDACLARLPVSKWMSAVAADHVAAAREITQGGLDVPSLSFLRILAAAHAFAALDLAPDLESARAVLAALGYFETSGGRWETSADAALLWAGSMRRSGLLAMREAVARLRKETPFRSRYAAAALRLLAGVSDRDAVRDAMELLMRAQSGTTATEAAHVKALLDGFADAKVCSKCDGVGTTVCSSCSGKGRKSATCGGCGGHGFIITVGKGGGKKSCPSCGGRPVKEIACRGCAGRTKTDCSSCAAAWRPPAPAKIFESRRCELCDGTGIVGSRGANACPSCAGFGAQLVPTRDPGAVLK